MLGLSSEQLRMLGLTRSQFRAITDVRFQFAYFQMLGLSSEQCRQFTTLQMLGFSSQPLQMLGLGVRFQPLQFTEL